MSMSDEIAAIRESLLATRQSVIEGRESLFEMRKTLKTMTELHEANNRLLHRMAVEILDKEQ